MKIIENWEENYGFLWDETKRDEEIATNKINELYDALELAMTCIQAWRDTYPEGVSGIDAWVDNIVPSLLESLGLDKEQTMNISKHETTLPDWCHLCGVRSYTLVDIRYPDNAEHETHNVHYIRICKECGLRIAEIAEIA